MRAAGVACAVALAVTALTATADEKKGGKAAPITDDQFVSKAASGGVYEVESSKLAQTSATNPGVKKFAEKMIADHTKANQELAGIASKAGIQMPPKVAEHHQKMIDQLRMAKGGDFDKTYMMQQAKAHDEAIMVFSSGAQYATNPDLKAFAQKTLPVIKEHARMVKDMNKGGTGDHVTTTPGSTTSGKGTNPGTGTNPNPGKNKNPNP